MKLSAQFAFGLLAAIAMFSKSEGWSECGCDSCTQDVWDSMADTFTCGARITWLVNELHYSTRKACDTVAGKQFPIVCGSCNPSTCINGNEQSSPPAPKPGNILCGCDSCTEQVWNNDAAGFSCRARIVWLRDTMGQKEEDACREVAGVQFPTECGGCNPDTCNNNDVVPATPENTPLPSPAPTPPSPAPTANKIQSPTPENYQPPAELYCFPPEDSRKRYNNVWGKYTLEVKEGANCAPGNNVFNRDTVSVEGSDLRLELSKINGRWHSSEVRVLLPTNEHYDYGTYKFSLKSVQIIDGATGQVRDTKLPPSVILGLFSWDASENYAVHENYNHEVDIELSQWDIQGNADVQFLVQPPGDPQEYRFFSGGQTESFQQAPNVYGFEWKPAEVQWFSTAGGGQHFKYNTQMALDANQPDYTQCMPAQVEMRINLWHLYGSLVQPTGLQDTDRVEVVIDNFEFTPSGNVAVPIGGVCSKDCQCGDFARCVANRCTAGVQVETSPLMTPNVTSDNGVKYICAIVGTVLLAMSAFAACHLREWCNNDKESRKDHEKEEVQEVDDDTAAETIA